MSEQVNPSASQPDTPIKGSEINIPKKDAQGNDIPNIKYMALWRHAYARKYRQPGQDYHDLLREAGEAYRQVYKVAPKKPLLVSDKYLDKDEAAKYQELTKKIEAKRIEDMKAKAAAGERNAIDYLAGMARIEAEKLEKKEARKLKNKAAYEQHQVAINDFLSNKDEFLKWKAQQTAAVEPVIKN